MKIKYFVLILSVIILNLFIYKTSINFYYYFITNKENGIFDGTLFLFIFGLPLSAVSVFFIKNSILSTLIIFFSLGVQVPIVWNYTFNLFINNKNYKYIKLFFIILYTLLIFIFLSLNNLKTRNIDKYILLNNNQIKQKILNNKLDPKEVFNIINQNQHFHFNYYKYNFAWFYQKENINSDPWIIFMAENTNYDNQNYIINALTDNLDNLRRIEERKYLGIDFNHMQYNLNLKDSEVKYRAYFWFKKGKMDAYTLVDIKNKYADFSDLLNTNLVLTDQQKALMGDSELSFNIYQQYKTNNDQINYTKWLWISAENGNKQAQEELGKLMLSDNITDQELMILHLNKDEKDLKGQFWINRSKETEK